MSAWKIVGLTLFILVIVAAKGLRHVGGEVANVAKHGDDAITSLGKSAGITDEMIKGADLNIPVHSPDAIPTPDPSGKWYAGEAAARAVSKAAQCHSDKRIVAADMSPLMQEPDEYARSLGYINRGQPVCVDAVEGEWSHVHSGWIRTRFLIEAKHET